MEEDQQFCLRWNNHQSTLISVFDTLLENGTLVDCTLAAEGKFLKAHKVVLSACSPYFATLLSQQYDKHPIFILKDVKFQELRAMMDYMYRGEVNISQDQLGALLKAAESLQIKGLSDNRSSSTTQKNDTKQQVPVSKSGLTIEHKRPLKHPAIDIDSDMAVSREGSTSPTSRKRKKFRRRSTEGNSITDNHDHSNSSSQSLPHVASTSGSVNNLNTSVVNVTKKTEILQQQIDIKTGLDHVLDDNEENHDDDDEDEELASSEKQETDILSEKDKQHMDTHSELMIEPKNEYDDSETVEDLTLEDEELLEDLDQAGPSHGGEGSSQGYAQWQVERSQDEVFMASQESTGQHRDAQAVSAKVKTTPITTTTTTTTSSPSQEQEKRFLKNSFKKIKTLNQNTSSSTSSSLLSLSQPIDNNTNINNSTFKNLNQFHPRIKYSKHKNPNPTIHQALSSKTSTSSSSSIDIQIATTQQQQQQQDDEHEQNEHEQNEKSDKQIKQHFRELEIITSGNSSNVDNDDLHSSIMTDLANYAEIDDIELPDGSQIGFGDVDEFHHQDDTKNHSSASLDDDYNMMSDSMKFEYLSDSAVSATDELGRHYICRHCGKRYRWKSTLRRHENVECGGKEPMHQCPHCPYKAKQRGNLGVHIRKHHTAMPPLESRRKLNRSN